MQRGLTGPADTASTMDRGNAAPSFIILEHSEDVPHILDRFRQGPIDYWESVIFDVGKAHCLGASGKVRSVRSELVDLGEVYKRSDAGREQSFYLLFRNAWAPGVFTGKEEMGGPV